ncbi:MAG: 1-deoxy-D-xylulose-5-phosphate synthase, partial [Akkermansiaceae bacterium]|nr:1-deoxy-D-xylulose-5-phosphate synthase [Armatimonadota bacterium]
LEAARELEIEHGVRASVVNARFCKPLDAETILPLARRAGCVITLEDGVIRGGFGSAVIELLQENGMGDVSVKTLGLPDAFVEHGPIPILRGLCGMDTLGVLNAAGDLLGKPLAPTTPGEAAFAGRVATRA